MIVPVVLSGGSGSRLWPLSRSLYPKQFIDLINKTTLFQDTILRLPADSANPLIICNEEHRFLAAEQLRQIKKKSSGIILEPVGKNTAPALALAAIELNQKLDDPVLLVLSADHAIQDINAFHNAIKVAESQALKGKLVTFGIEPTSPETGYGYIQVKTQEDSLAMNISSFKEKPNAKLAKKYLKENNQLKLENKQLSWFWNSGMFMFKASTYLTELEKFEPKILAACKKSFSLREKDFDFIRLNNNEFSKCPEKSIDYAVMEHTSNSVIVPLKASWSDIGSWSSLMDTKPKDKNGNIVQGDAILDEVNDTFALSSNRLIAAIGVSNLVIVDTQDALLVANKDHSQKIKGIVERLKKSNRHEIHNHRKVYRPWGFFDSIDNGDGFQVKRILVKPGAKLSLQKHRYRSEHWVVINGTALVTCEKKVFELTKNQSTYIPQNSVHRLENKQNIPLEIIEIQTGTYLGEDDIIRLEDDYHRN